MATRAMEHDERFATIRIVGVGGGGSNAVNRMIEERMQGVDFVAVNTDAQALMHSAAPTRVRIGDKLTRGLGSGGHSEVGEKAALESVDELNSVLQDSDMVFITAGMGGGTGTGASPVIAETARNVGALTIGVVTKPFTFEGSRRVLVAEEGINKLKEQVDTLIVIPNDRLLEMADKRTSLQASFRMADEVLRQGIQGISELITVPGLINLDFADVKAIMSMGGAALMAVGTGEGEDAAAIASEQAINNRLLDISIDGARGILFNITGGPDMSLHAVNQAAEIIRETAHPEVNLIFGAVIDKEMVDRVRIPVIATGFDKRLKPITQPQAKPAYEPSEFVKKAEKKPEEKKVDFKKADEPKEAERKFPFAKKAAAEPAPKEQPPAATKDEEDLEIPAFIRKKMM